MWSSCGKITRPALRRPSRLSAGSGECPPTISLSPRRSDRKSTRLNSSHGYISYAVFCLKKNSGVGVRRGCVVAQRRRGIVDVVDAELQRGAAAALSEVVDADQIELGVAAHVVRGGVVLR